jgi:hypothetical protein
VNNRYNLFGDVMSRDCFLQIFWMMHVGKDTIKKINQAIKRTKKVHGVIRTYRETVSEIFCTGWKHCNRTINYLIQEQNNFQNL